MIVEKQEGQNALEENALVQAIAIVVDRISRLSEQDRSDLYEVLHYFNSSDPEESEAARQAFKEILDQRPIRVERIEFPEGPGQELESWIEFVSRRIRDARKKAGLTQVALAEAAGIPQSHISRLENGAHSPTSMTLEKIADALGVPVTEFDPSA